MVGDIVNTLPGIWVGSCVYVLAGISIYCIRIL